MLRNYYGLYRGLIAGVLLWSVVGSISCSSDSTGPKSSVLTPSQVYWQLQLNQHAVTMALTAPVNSIQLVATPFNADGSPLNGLGRVTYTPADSVVRVDSTGLVTAQYTTQLNAKTFVVARLTDSSQHVTLTDTCFIKVTETAPGLPMASFSIQPTTGDSAKRAYRNGIVYTVQPVAKDADSVSFTGFFPYFYSSNINIAAIDKNTGDVQVLQLDHVTFYAQTWSYGVAKLDSLRFEVTPSLFEIIYMRAFVPTGSTKPELHFFPSIVTVGVGGSVKWQNQFYNDTVDVMFDDPSNVDSSLTSFYGLVYSTGSGNIPPWAYDTLGTGSDSIANKINEVYRHFPLVQYPGCLSGSGDCGQRSREFPVAGVYHFHSTKQPTSGTVYVQ